MIYTAYIAYFKNNCEFIFSLQVEANENSYLKPSLSKKLRVEQGLFTDRIPLAARAWSQVIATLRATCRVA